MSTTSRSRLPILVLGLALLTAVPACQGPALPAGQALIATGDTRWSRVSDSQAADVKVAQGRSFENRGDLANATAAYQDAIKNDSHRADAYVRLARIRDGQGRFRESQELYEKALQAAPGSADVCCDMGYSLYLQRRWREAETSLRQAIALQPDHHRAHTNLALVLAHQDRDTDALAEFRRAGCTQAAAHANLGFVRMVQGSWSDAQHEYQQALAADPSCQAARKGLAELKAVVRRLDAPSSNPDLADSLTPPKPPSSESPYAPVLASPAVSMGSPYAPVSPSTDPRPGLWVQSASARTIEPASQP